MIFWIIKKVGVLKKDTVYNGASRKGLSRKEIAVEFGYTREDTLDRLMKKYGYNKIDGKFVLTVEDSCPPPVQNGGISIIEEVCPPNGGHLLSSLDAQNSFLYS